MALREFDLNIEEVLENWEIEHAIREIIANALDEQALSMSAEIEILKDKKGDWHIRDFGRGLAIKDFTLNENQEKLEAKGNVIGKFGVGLKDALATFFRRGIGVVINSSHGVFRLKQAKKHGFKEIQTLHVEYDDVQTDFQGTELILSGVTDAKIQLAKSLFLKFADEKMLEIGNLGHILERSKDGAARVYISGVLASEEPNFLFSYNITDLTSSMKKSLNRERLNVGRTTYADRVKSILKNASNERVKAQLIDQVSKRAIADQCDEMAWIEISQKALTLKSQQTDVIYFTDEEIQAKPSILDSAKRDGLDVLLISEIQKSKLQTQNLQGGPQVRTVEKYEQEFNSSFVYKFIEYESLTNQEQMIYDLTGSIIDLVNIFKFKVPHVRISETMRITGDAQGVWDSELHSIIIKRSELGCLKNYAGVVLHEVAHVFTETDDVTREFENVLSEYLGIIAKEALKLSGKTK